MYHQKRQLTLKFIICEIDKDSFKGDEIILRPLELNDGYESRKKVFETQDEAIHYLESSSTPLVGKHIVVLPYLKVGY